MRTLVLVLFVTAIIASGIAAYTYFLTYPKQMYELQERCGKQAADLFKSKDISGVTVGKDGRFRGESQDYSNHYSARLNKCFYLETRNIFPENKTDGRVDWRILSDINENKTYGQFRHTSNSTNAAPDECYVQEKKCSSAKEWIELVKPFMED